MPGFLKKSDRLSETNLDLAYPISHESAERDILAGQAGFEPATTGFVVRRSIQLELMTPNSPHCYNLISLCTVWVRQEGQNFFKDNLSVVLFLFFVLA